MTRGRVVIIGGGVIGSSTAYHLRRNAYDGPVTVVERDPSYRRASSFLAMGGVRQQFSSRANIAMAQHSVRFYRRFDETMAVPGHTPRARFTPRGYLFLVTDETADRFEDRYARQRDLGARVERVAPEAIRRLVPDLFLDDIRFGVLGPDDGYANPREVLAGFRHAAAAAGAEYVTGDVVEIARRGDVVTGVVLDTGDRLEGPVVVNAAGAFAARIGELAGVDVPRAAGPATALPLPVAASVASQVSGRDRSDRRSLATRGSADRGGRRPHHRSADRHGRGSGRELHV